MSVVENLLGGKLADIEKSLCVIEQKRKASIIPCFLFALAVGAVFFVPTLFFIDFDLLSIIIAALLIYIPVFVGSKYAYTKDLSNIYKNKVMPELVQVLFNDKKKTDDDKCSYRQEYNPDIEVFRDSMLFEKYSDDNVLGEDVISGKFDKTDFSFFEGHYSYETTDSDGDTITKSLFDGVVFYVDFNKSFLGQTLLVPKKLGHLPTNVFCEIQLENNAFNKMFKVYTTDEVEARYLLSLSLQERIINMMLNLDKLSDIGNLSLSFFNNRLLVLGPSSVDHFEAKLFSKLKLDRVKADFQLVYDMIDIIDELNLNTRIWTKE